VDCNMEVKEINWPCRMGYSKEFCLGSVAFRKSNSLPFPYQNSKNLYLVSGQHTKHSLFHYKIVKMVKLKFKRLI